MPVPPRAELHLRGMASPTSTPLRMASYVTATGRRRLNEWTLNAVLAASLGLTLEVQDERMEKAAAKAEASAEASELSRLVMEAAEAATVQPSSTVAEGELQAEMQARAAELQAELLARAVEMQAARAEC